MIITRTPYRISFFGGGTDYPVWYKENGGAVLSSSINKYCYLMCRILPSFFKTKHRIVYSKIELPNHIFQINHPSVRETLHFLKWRTGVEIQHHGDLPAMTGIGSSSSFTVGLLNALCALKGEIKNKRQLAMEAIHIEQNLIKEHVGSQDQVVAAFGGFNKIEFGGPNKIAIHPVAISEKRLNEFQNRLMLFFTGKSRNASTIAKNWIANTQKNKEELSAILEMVDKSINILTGKKNLDEIGRMLHEAWQIKRELTENITTSKIDEIYKMGLKAGAIGGKLLGAGGGGFMLFYADPGAQDKIKNKLGKLLQVPFKFEHSGSQIIYHAPLG